MKVSILLFPGINREKDMAHAVRTVTGADAQMIWYTETEIPQSDCIIIPGGFSFGDYLRPGAIAARAPVIADLHKKADEGVSVLGICNGFQVLTETQLLPGSLMRNAGLKFICRELHIKVINNATKFTSHYSKDQVIRVPVAHHDGNYVTDQETLKRLEDQDQIVFRYCDETGAVTKEANPNGSMNNIAGIMNDNGNVMGAMPHPENLIENALGGTDGLGLFESLLERIA